MTLDALFEEKVELVANEYSRATTPWVVGFSGGKDSSLVVKIFFEALSRIRQRRTMVNVVYCDTGVEIPVVAAYVTKTLKRMEYEAKANNLPIRCHVAKPLLSDTFFVRLIGRGYAPPTNKFRWCTDKLRIHPIQRLMDTISNDEGIVVLGVRQEESEERKRILTRHATKAEFYYRQSSSQNRRLFCPIVDLSTASVWEGLFSLPRPLAISAHELGRLYKQASGECPVVRETKGSPCGQGRFGCWTCTVVRQDKAVQGLIREGYTNLRPLLEFRDWLLEIRDDIAYRCTVRRNGRPGLGPFRVSARKVLLRKLLAAQRRSGLKLVKEAEIKKIRSLWSLDMNSPSHLEDPATSRKAATHDTLA